MSKYRDRLQIIANILSIASRRAKKTQIMYQANLSYRLLCRYLDLVLSAGLVNITDEESYALTAKGKEFLARHEQYLKRRSNLQEHLENVNNEKIALQNMSLEVIKHSGNINDRTSNKESRK